MKFLKKVTNDWKGFKFQQNDTTVITENTMKCSLLGAWSNSANGASTDFRQHSTFYAVTKNAVFNTPWRKGTVNQFTFSLQLPIRKLVYDRLVGLETKLEKTELLELF